VIKDNHAKWSNVKRQSTQDFPWSKSDGAAVTIEGSRHLSLAELVLLLVRWRLTRSEKI